MFDVQRPLERYRLIRPSSDPSRHSKADRFKIKVVAWIRKLHQFIARTRATLCCAGSDCPPYPSLVFVLQAAFRKRADIDVPLAKKGIESASNAWQAGERVFSFLPTVRAIWAFVGFGAASANRASGSFDATNTLARSSNERTSRGRLSGLGGQVDLNQEPGTVTRVLVDELIIDVGQVDAVKCCGTVLQYPVLDRAVIDMFGFDLCRSLDLNELLTTTSAQ